jgi:hypothetical protein
MKERSEEVSASWFSLSAGIGREVPVLARQAHQQIRGPDLVRADRPALDGR